MGWNDRIDSDNEIRYARSSHLPRPRSIHHHRYTVVCSRPIRMWAHRNLGMVHVHCESS
jgi:hypothetical protein